MTLHFEYDVFISYSPKDMPVVRELAERLKEDELRVWLDEWVIQPGDSIQQAIELGLENSRTLVLVMSKNTFASEWVTIERNTALFRDPNNQQRRFIPLRIDDCDIRDSIKQFAYVDWRNKDEEQYIKLLIACRSNIGKSTSFSSHESQLVKGNDSKIRLIRRIACGTEHIYSLNVSRTKGLLVSGSADCTARVWDVRIGKCLAVLVGKSGEIARAVFTLDESSILTACFDGRLEHWNISTKSLYNTWIGHHSIVSSVSVLPNGRQAVSSSFDRSFKLWDINSGKCVKTIPVHGGELTTANVSPDGRFIVAGHADNIVRLWSINSGERLISFQGHTGLIRYVDVTPDNRFIVSSSVDRSIRVWEISSGACIRILEGHSDGSWMRLQISPDGCLIATTGFRDTTVRLWDWHSGKSIAVIKNEDGAYPSSISFSPDGNQLYVGTSTGQIYIYGIEKKSMLSGREVTGVYTNAKVIVVGDSGVGKSGIVVRLTENKFKPTFSTDAHWATQLKLPFDFENDEISREIWLWDFAGQADFRLIHQLFMDETAVSVLVFNPQDENLFEKLCQWDSALERAARRKYAKLLVAGRCDRGGLMVSRRAIEEFARQKGFANYIETSALTGDGCNLLRDEIFRQINWDLIPWTASPRIFKLLKDEILSLRIEGVILLRISELKQQLEMRLFEEVFTIDELRAVVGLLAGPGIIWKLEFGDIVILQPEWINKYATAVIRSVRAHIGEIGVIDEAKVLAGDLNYTLDSVHHAGCDESINICMQRLNPSDEAIVLRAMHQMFVDRGLCVREELESGGRQLIFPSYFKQELPTDPGHPPILVNYQFDGHAEEIYSTLVVQLWHTKAFEHGDLWRYAADFKSATGARLGLKMVRHVDKKPEINLYFDQNVNDDTKVTFIRYIHEHLLQKAQDVVRLRSFVCPHCGHPVRDTELAREILNAEGANAEIRCQQRKCDSLFPLWDIIEQKFASDNYQQRVHELKEKAKTLIDNESRELILEGHARIITGEAGQIYRGYTGSDHGIDGEIEFKNDAGQASGKRLYLQLKSGDSYLYRRKSDGAEIFQIKKQRWATYWLEQAYPVMLVLRTSDGEIRWMNVTKYLEEKNKNRETPIKSIIFNGKPFTALNLLRLRDHLILARENIKCK